MKKRITLFILSQVGFEVLRSLKSKKELIDKVIIGKDSTIKDYYKEIKLFCKNNNIKCENKKKINVINTEFAIAICWKWLINSKKKIIVLHDSLLPKYRGFFPLGAALINKEKIVGVSAIFATSEYDRGNIIAQNSIKINYPITIRSAKIKITKIYINILKKLINLIEKKKHIKSKKQDEKKATYCVWRNEDNFRIDWSKDSEYILRFINALSEPYKGASSYFNGKLCRILKAETVKDVKIINRDYGKIIFLKEKKPIVICGKGLIMITDAKYENQKSLLPIKKFKSKFN